MKIEKLKLDNFYVWKQTVQLLLVLRDVETYFTEEGIPSEGDSPCLQDMEAGRSEIARHYWIALSDDH